MHSYAVTTQPRLFESPLGPPSGKVEIRFIIIIEKQGETGDSLIEECLKEVSKREAGVGVHYGVDLETEEK